MKKENVLSLIQSNKEIGKKMLAILIDPDKIDLNELPNLIDKINNSNASILFVGGSLLFKNILDTFVKTIKSLTNLPVILFPGSAIQITDEADSLLFLQLISGRNADFLIGNQVVAAPLLKQTNLEIISTGYLLIESGRETTASYISNTKPLPSHKPEIAMATAMAGELIGQKLIYLDGGSGALNSIPTNLINKVTSAINLPVIVGGGIKTKQQMQDAFDNGATVVVIGTAFEKNQDLLNQF